MNKKNIVRLTRHIYGICSWQAILYSLCENWYRPYRTFVHLCRECLLYIKQLYECYKLNKRVKIVAHNMITHNTEVRIKDIVKPIAFYLPQFHKIPENDKWWGEGFTEWTNVKKARPLFEGHYQPHVPHPDIGYYDLSDVNVMRKQAEMAKEYGVYGFSFYYYYFKGGKRLLEKPLNNWLAAKDIDFPFCFCWANENWTRTWDGGDKEILMLQDYDKTNMERLLKEMLPAFKDNRYIKVDSKPLLLVYRPELIPDINNIALSWRNIAKTAGFKDLYLVRVQSFSEEAPIVYGFDAACDFAVGYRGVDSFLPCGQNSGVKISDFINGNRCQNVNIYENIVRWCARSENINYTKYRSVTSGWDNSARRGKYGSLVIGSTPELFGKSILSAVTATIGDERISRNGFLFINAWNEWGEGAHLEPDVRNGYDYLQVLKQVMDLKLNHFAG